MSEAVTFSLMPKQHDFVTDEHRFPAFVSGLGAGKTFGGSVKALARLDGPGYGMIAAPNYKMLMDSTRRTMLEVLIQAKVPHELHKGDNTITIPSTGHEIICRSLDNPETLRGPNLSWAWVDEAALVDGMAWKIVKGRIREGDNPQAWITTTPKGRNWIWEEWVQSPDRHHSIHRTKTTDNYHLPADYAESLGYEGRFAEQELGGEFVAFEGVVYPMFNRAEHVTHTDTEGWTPYLGVDVGTRNPTAILTGYRGSDRWHIGGEVYRRGMSSDEIIDAITAEADRVQPEAIFLDPSANDYILTLERKGYPAVKANNDVTYGIGIVTTALVDGLTIDPACVNLIAEIETYHYPDNRTESDKPVKEFDHAADALRYLTASLSPMLEGPLVF